MVFLIEWVQKKFQIVFGKVVKMKFKMMFISKVENVLDNWLKKFLIKKVWIMWLLWLFVLKIFQKVYFLISKKKKIIIKIIKIIKLKGIVKYFRIRKIVIMKIIWKSFRKKEGNRMLISIMKNILKVVIVKEANIRIRIKVVGKLLI